MQAEGIATGIFRRGGLTILLYEPHHASVLIDEILREKRGLLAGDDELRLVGVEDEDVEVITLQSATKFLYRISCRFAWRE